MTKIRRDDKGRIIKPKKPKKRDRVAEKKRAIRRQGGVVSPKYTGHIARRFCTELAKGKSANKIHEESKESGENWAPSPNTVRKWYRDFPDFAAMYDVALIDRADSYLDKIFDIFDRVERGELDLNRARFLVEQYKWIVCKMHPRYAESKQAALNLNLNGNEKGGIEFNIIMADTASQRRITDGMRQAEESEDEKEFEEAELLD